MHKSIEGWFVSFFAVSGAFVLCGFGGLVIAKLLNISEIHSAGFFAAFGVVSMAYISAPQHSVLASTVTFILGTLAAWCFLREAQYYEHGEYFQNIMYSPLTITILGGLSSLVVCILPVIARKKAA